MKFVVFSGAAADPHCVGGEEWADYRACESVIMSCDHKLRFITAVVSDWVQR